MLEAAQAKAMTRASIDGNLTELNLGGIRQTASELALHSLAQGFKPNDDHEKMQFYYHPDHLGSSSSKGNHYSLDTQHGEFEVLDKRGKHQGAVNFNGERTKKPNSSGKHNIKI